MNGRTRDPQLDMSYDHRLRLFAEEMGKGRPGCRSQILDTLMDFQSRNDGGEFDAFVWTEVKEQFVAAVDKICPKRMPIYRSSERSSR